MVLMSLENSLGCCIALFAVEYTIFQSNKSDHAFLNSSNFSQVILQKVLMLREAIALVIVLRAMIKIKTVSLFKFVKERKNTWN